MRSAASALSTGTVCAVPVDIRMATVDDYDELFAAFSRIVGAREGFPQLPPLSRATSTTTGSSTPQRSVSLTSAAI